MLRLLVQTFHARQANNPVPLDARILWNILRALHQLCWMLILLIRYYPDTAQGASPSAEIANNGLGERGECPIPTDIWERYVPDSLVDNIRHLVPGGMFRVRPPRGNTAHLLMALERDNFLLRLDPSSNGPSTDNLSAFLRPKSSTKAAFIADLRAANCLSPQPKPSFRLPSLSSIAEVISASPAGALWATTIDLTNFFWSLRLPKKAWGIFRIQGLFFPCPPFGWDLSPILAQTTLGRLLDEAMATLPYVRGVQYWIFHYYDDILLLAQNPCTAAAITRQLITYLLTAGLLISIKSSLTPAQSVTWLGKTFDLTRRTISNTPATKSRCVAMCLLACLVPLHPKLIDRICGFMLWAGGPHKGCTMLLSGWYLTRWSTHYLPRAYFNMARSLLDLCVTTLTPWTAPTAIPPPWLCTPVCLDAAYVNKGYQVGLFSPTWGGRIVRCPDYVTSQQAAELYAIDAATRLAVRLGLHHVSLFGDNLGALHIFRTLRPPISSPALLTTTRRIANRLRWSNLRAHLLWVPSGTQPADPLSRCLRECPISLTQYIILTKTRWYILCSDTYIAEKIGLLTT